MSFKKIGRKVIDVIFSLVIIVVLIALVTSYIGFQPYVVRSGSMEPEIHTASVAIVNENVNFYDIEVGDVVAFKLQTGELVTHRVIEITKIDGITHFMTKGDNNDVADGYTTNIQNYYGKTIYSIPNLGYFMDWMTSMQGRFIMIGAGLIMILLYMFMEEEKRIYVLFKHVQDTEDMKPGDTRHFCFTFQSDTPAENLFITEILPDGLIFVPNSAIINGKCDEKAYFDEENSTLSFSVVDVKKDEIMLEFDLIVPDIFDELRTVEEPVAEMEENAATEAIEEKKMPEIETVEEEYEQLSDIEEGNVE